MAGWNAAELLYSFDDYENDPFAGPTSSSTPAPGAAPGRRLLAVKVRSVGSLLRVSLQLVGTTNGVAGPEQVLELDVEQYTARGAGGGGAGGAADKGLGLKEVPDLVHRVQGALDEVVRASNAGAADADGDAKVRHVATLAGSGRGCGFGGRRAELGIDSATFANVAFWQ